jgi:hypothetical protein
MGHRGDRGTTVAARDAGATMHIELSREEAELLRDTLQQRVRELAREINRTERRAFKRELQADDRMIERIADRLSLLLDDIASVARRA